MKKLYIILLLGISTACDPMGGEAFYVHNKSDFDINVGYRLWDIDTMITIYSKQSALIFEDHYLGKPYDKGDKFLTQFDTLFISIIDTMVIKKDYLKREKWEVEITGVDNGSGNRPLTNYSFILENKDIIK